MRIAIVAYDFPPLNSGGSQRPYFLAKFLMSQNIDVTVFTLNEINYPSGALNYEMDKDFVKSCAIIRTDLRRHFASKIFETYYFNLVDMIGVRWQEQLEKAVLKEQLKAPFNYLLFSCPPFSLASLGISISKKINVPLVLDMRDAWSQWVAAPYATYFHYRGTLKLERKALSQAKFVTYVSEQQKVNFLRNHPDIEPTKFIYAPNGFEEYTDSSVPSGDQIKIFYAGSFYYNPESERLIKTAWYRKKPHQFLQYVPRIEEWKYRSPYFFFQILKRLIELEPDLGKRITVLFAGKKPEWFDDMVTDSGLKRHVAHLGFLDKHQMRIEMSKVNCFLVTSVKVNNGRDICVAGKTYEYLSYRKPIIGVVTEGEQKDLLEKSGVGIVLNPDKVVDSVQKLKDSLLRNIINPDINFIDQFRIPNNYSNLLKILKARITS